MSKKLTCVFKCPNPYNFLFFSIQHFFKRVGAFVFYLKIVTHDKTLNCVFKNLLITYQNILTKVCKDSYV